MAASISFADVSKRYPGGVAGAAAALDHASFDIAAGEFVYLTGHSGAGKSTVFRLLAAIERPTAGTVLVNQQNVGRLSRGGRPVPAAQSRPRAPGPAAAVRPHVFDNVSLPLAVAGVPPRDAARRARAALDKVGLLGRERANPIALSGGEQQRVCIARAVVNRPALLLADEPTANLDAEYAGVILELFRAFHDVGVTVRPGDARRGADRALSGALDRARAGTGGPMNAWLHAHDGAMRDALAHAGRAPFATLFAIAVAGAGAGAAAGRIRRGRRPGPDHRAIRHRSADVGVPAAGGHGQGPAGAGAKPAGAPGNQAAALRHQGRRRSPSCSPPKACATVVGARRATRCPTRWWSRRPMPRARPSMRCGPSSSGCPAWPRSRSIRPGSSGWRESWAPCARSPVAVAAMLGVAVVAVTFNTVRLQVLTRARRDRRGDAVRRDPRVLRRPFLYFGAFAGHRRGTAVHRLGGGFRRIAGASLPGETAAAALPARGAAMPRQLALAALLAAAGLGWLGAWLSVWEHLGPGRRTHR